MEEYVLTQPEFERFRDLIYKLAGISLSDSKKQLVQSRLQKRLRHLGMKRFAEYYDLVATQGADSAEVIELVNCITTNKTDFYREPYHFEFVTNHVLPEMKHLAVSQGQANSPKRLRVWHAGCSTGEEPYTLAITLAEALSASENWDVRQLASDIDTHVLAHAARGIYERERVAPIPRPLLQKYFFNGRGAQCDYVKVRPELQRWITFRRINLLDESWPIRADVRFDMIFCRNVVIYFDKPTRQRLFTRFATLLRPGGYLFVGHSESLIGISDAFTSLGKTIYRLPPSLASPSQASDRAMRQKAA